jgi:hypothetical protein
MQHQIELLQQTLNTVIQQSSNKAPSQQVAVDAEHVASPYATMRSPAGGTLVGPLTSASNLSDSMISTRSIENTNTRMDMTRENSPEPCSSADRDVLVTEPMGSLYEVTRLRNIRSNQSRTYRSEAEDESDPDDLISRGVSVATHFELISERLTSQLIGEAEAQELYEMLDTPQSRPIPG